MTTAEEGDTFVDETGPTWTLARVADPPEQERLFVSPQDMTWIRSAFNSPQDMTWIRSAFNSHLRQIVEQRAVRHLGARSFHGEWRMSEDEIRDHRRDAGRFAARRQEVARRGALVQAMSTRLLPALIPNLFQGTR